MKKNYWSIHDFKWCVDKAMEVHGNASVLRGAASHGNALYVFISTINIWHAVRFTKHEGDMTKYQFRPVSPITLSEYYSGVKMDKFDLRRLGYRFEGMIYSELEDEK